MKKTIEKISETTEGWFFEKIKLRNLQPDLSRKRRKMQTQINKIRNEKLQLMSQKYTDHKRLLQVTCTCVYTQSLSHSFSLQPHGLQPLGSSVNGISQARNSGTGCHLLLQGIFLTQGLNQNLLHLPHWQVDSLPPSWEAYLLYANKMNKLEEMEKFLERCNLIKVRQEEIENMNRPITSTGIETDLKTRNKQKSRTRQLNRQIISNIQRRANTYSSESIPKNHRGTTHSRRPPSPFTKNRKRYHKKENYGPKLLMNINANILN